ncbi:MAG: hypothetical protein GXP56_10470 [Deltaproteobacteria bacterium]|nr:hypothetical protein [Deltaproteobacteria bacterium]
MPGTKKRLSHPLLSYLIGSFFMVLSLIILIGVMYHISFSRNGPELLGALVKKYEAQTKSPIMDEAQRLLEMEKHNHFHNFPVEYPKLPDKMKPVCFICHSDFPHTKNKRIRSLMNMHTQFFACETCHIKEKPNHKIVYKWYNPLDKNSKGPFFGTSYDPQTGSLLEGDDHIAKITPFFRRVPENKNNPGSQNPDNLLSVIQLQDTPFAKDYVKIRNRLSPEEREGIKNKFHKNIKPKGHDCKDCHTKNSILDFKRLGFSEHRIKYLKTLEIIGMLSHYEDFYLPKLFPNSKSSADNKKKQ